MPVRFNSKDAGFEKALTAFLGKREQEEAQVRDAVSAILREVQAKGDDAVLAYTNQFDKVSYTAQTMRVSAEELKKAEQDCAGDVKEALALAAQRIRFYHEKQLPKDERYTDASGVELGWRWTPLEAVGLYVPGGLASYPSSVLMNAVPAKVAGVKRLVITVPTPRGELNPAVLVAASLAGVDEIYKIGGAQAVGALAYGTQSIASADKIVGPGNAYVAEAKRQVFGRVGIDMIAGPSEILVIADNKNDPRWIAADLLSQAEHDETAQSVLITNDAAFADKVAEAVEALLAGLQRKDIASASWRDFGAIIVTGDMKEAVAHANAFAPEHLELAVENPDALLPLVTHAGAVFMGRYTPEAIGDYIAGPSHVLPTSRSARFSSGLSVLDFMKRTSLIRCDAASFKVLAGPGITLAEAEGLQAHALSMSLRKN